MAASGLLGDQFWTDACTALAYPPGPSHQFITRTGEFVVEDKIKAVDECVQKGRQARSPQIGVSCTLWLKALPRDAADDAFEGPLQELANVDIATGEVSVDKYGASEPPLQHATKSIVVASTFNKWGIWKESKIFRNKGTLTSPMMGDLIRTYTTDATDDTKDLKAAGYTYTARVSNGADKTTRTVTFDNTRGFRKTREGYVRETPEGRVDGEITYSYSDDFLYGKIPTTIRVLENGKQIAEGVVIGIDPQQRRIRVRVGDAITSVALDDIE